MVYKKRFVVEKKHLANIVGSGTSPVLSTPSLLAFIEKTCMESINSILIKSKDSTCVGVKTELYHLKPCVIGDRIMCHSELNFTSGSKLCFKIEVFESDNLIAKCDHTRYLIDKDFYKK